MTNAGFRLEALMHRTLQRLPETTCLREADIKARYGRHITGIDHLVRYWRYVVCIQDKWETACPNTRDISHVRAQSELLMRALRRERPEVYKLSMIFASRRPASITGQVSMQEHGIKHIHRECMAGLVADVAHHVGMQLGWRTERACWHSMVHRGGTAEFEHPREHQVYHELRIAAHQIAPMHPEWLNMFQVPLDAFDLPAALQQYERFAHTVPVPMHAAFMQRVRQFMTLE